jgi:hypothetical protein
MPDRLPSLILLVGFWIPPAMVGRATADLEGMLVLAWSLAWFLFQLNRIPPYVPGATHDPTYAPPEAVAGLALVASALVLPGSAIACLLAFRTRARGLTRATAHS